MFKVLIIRSTYSDVPLAEIRTDGRNIEWNVDNTNGALPAQVGGNLDALYQIVRRSSHLRIEPQKESTARFLRYVLDNGDVVEITSDSKTCVLNGQLLTEPEKDALLGALGRGEVKVAHKPDTHNPVPVLPRAPARRKPLPATPKPGFDVRTIKEMTEAARKTKEAHEDDSVHYDSSIESLKMHGQDPLQAAMTRNMLYYAKYGQFKGGVNA